MGKTNKHSSPTTSLKGHLDYRIKKEGKEVFIQKSSFKHQQVMLLAALRYHLVLIGWGEGIESSTRTIQKCALCGEQATFFP